MSTWSVFLKMYATALASLAFGILFGSVLTTNQAPTFTTTATSVNVGENEAGHVTLYTIPVSDPDNDMITCSILYSDPSTDAFGVWPNSTDYALHVISGSTLNYTEHAAYTLSVGCTDGSLSADMNVTVYVLPNSPPTFTNLPATMSNVKVNTRNIGDEIYTVTATDVESTSLTFSVTSFPATPALFDIDPGRVFATKDLDYAVDNAYDLTITVSDNRDSATSNLVIPLTRVNSAPIIDNLPASISVSEDTNGNSVLYTLSVTEPDTGDSSTIYYSVTPQIYTSKITMNNNQVRLTNHNSLDYEYLSEFTVTFNVSDGKASSGPYNITIHVIDVNEQCAFASNRYYITMQEGNIGESVVDPGFHVTDDDVNDTFVFSLQGTTEASYFTMDPHTGNVTFSLSYDVDGTRPNSTSFRVYCTDSYGSDSFTTLYVTVQDTNDNSPTFSTTSSVLYFDQSMTVPYNVTTFTATDIDSGDNAVVHYSWTTTGTGGRFFTLSPNGLLILTKDPSPYFSNGDTFQFVVTAVDGGSPALTGTTIVDLIYWEQNDTAGTQSTSTGDSRFWDKPGNVAAVVLGTLLGSVLVGTLALVTKKYLTKKRVGTPSSLKVEPIQQMPDKPRFEFWKHNEFAALSTAVSTGIGQPGMMGTARGHPPPLF